MSARYVVRYMLATYEHEVEEFAYRAYVTEALRLQAQGKTLKDSWSEIIRQEKQPERDADDIIEEVIRTAGLVVRDDEPS